MAAWSLIGSNENGVIQLVTVNRLPFGNLEFGRCGGILQKLFTGLATCERISGADTCKVRTLF